MMNAGCAVATVPDRGTTERKHSLHNNSMSSEGEQDQESSDPATAQPVKACSAIKSPQKSTSASADKHIGMARASLKSGSAVRSSLSSSTNYNTAFKSNKLVPQSLGQPLLSQRSQATNFTKTTSGQVTKTTPTKSGSIGRGVTRNKAVSQVTTMQSKPLHLQEQQTT